MVHHAAVSRTGAAQVDTIYALATPEGRGAVAVVRLSGPEAFELAGQIVGDLPEARYAGLRVFRGATGEVIDQGIVICFPAPHSYTGENVVELQGHGGRAVTRALLDALRAVGARPAERGEFTQRAFLHGQMDLAQAEAVAALIDADSQVARRAALRSLQGALGEWVDEVASAIQQIRAQIEAELDFSDDLHEAGEETDDIGPPLESVRTRIRSIRQRTVAGTHLRHGLKVALIGVPNAGKSSLMNALVGSDVSIVNELPGTTRDVMRERIGLGEREIELQDTAGIRAGDEVGAVEHEGVRRALHAMDHADVVVLVTDANTPLTQWERHVLAQLDPTRSVVVRNKIDLDGALPLSARPTESLTRFMVCDVSALTGSGLDELRERLHELVAERDDVEPLAGEQRHLEALDRADEALAEAVRVERLQLGREITAEQLREAQLVLLGITRRDDNEALLDQIFRSFCIGK
ncbi:tRNA uridine-5-carboxymethylaminomethyl(34) synthesis GTPase MnmE [Halorhodospira abdelmalekii]|uniref:tRNA uridine-5-carboxymethylaminomethyl(34) synthesis GTPase MnmE n=1 Tax=Halorhodospira abdelmalekii TaxID=421629 RepID=UPI0019077F11|nr:tRNA uridine-5-carboxymethylaminomethyl(34) synthesis GTPase MnmE [Halorhodospira abdelmalekii]MBK1733692.1 tRNA uridine-5-carboxymethylaminomethyl(34) synthesis GTPase MnmE [Halorhodospira abdelmalekii]